MENTTLKKFIYGLAAPVGLLVFMLLTNPHNLPLPMLFVPFILLFFAIFYLVSLFMKLLAPGFSRNKRLIITFICAALPTLLLTLQSVGQSSLPDLLIASILMFGFIFYLARADFIK